MQLVLSKLWKSFSKLKCFASDIRKYTFFKLKCTLYSSFFDDVLFLNEGFSLFYPRALIMEKFHNVFLSGLWKSFSHLKFNTFDSNIYF